MHRFSSFTLVLFGFCTLLLFSTRGDYSGDYTLVSYSHGFYGNPGFLTNSWGHTKELFTEFSELSLLTNQSIIINLNETSMQRTVFDAPQFDGELLVYNSYNNFFEEFQESENLNYSEGNNNTVQGQAEDGGATLYFNSSTNVALLFMTDEYDPSYEEVGFGIVLRRFAGLTDADINGTYVRLNIGNQTSGETARGAGNIDSISFERSSMEFDGFGNYTEQIDEWQAHRVITERVITNDSDRYVDSYCIVGEPETDSYAYTNGTYTTHSNGTLTVNTDFGPVLTQLTPDHNLVVTTVAESNETSSAGYLVVGVKQPTAMPTNAIDAVYFSAEIEEEFGWMSPTAGNNHNSIEVGRSYIHLRSDGTFSMRSDYWTISNTLENERLVEAPYGIVSYNHFITESDPRYIELSNGTYSIAANGEMTLFFSDGDLGQAQMSENGEYVIYGFAEGEEGYAERFMGIGIRRNPPPAAAEPVVFDSEFTLTPIGGVFNASVPPGYNVEILASEDLSNTEWTSLFTTNAPSGELEILDPAALTSEARFYSATFGIW